MSQQPSATPAAPKCRITCRGVLVMHSQALLAGLFLFAAFNKLMGANGPQLFAGSVQAFFKVKGASGDTVAIPDWFTRLSTGVVPWTEVVAGLLLICGIWTRAAATVLSLLLVTFIVLIIQAIARDLDLHCGCFGKLSPFCPEKVGVCNIIQNSIMLAMALLIALTPRHKLAKAC
jgi:uncharacterized membrane protein YphA (DoxX/SURF4 family)